MWKKIISIFVIFIFMSPIYACTDFRLTGKDGTVLVTRSMEFAMNMQSNLRSSNRGREFSTMAPNGVLGLGWKATYGYLYLDAFNQDFAIDGLNEAGLSFEYLYLPGETQYQTIQPGQEPRSLPYVYLGDWVLSQFKSVDEVKQALSNIVVYQQTEPGFGNMIFPVHASIFDASGKGIVVEFVKGQMKIYDSIGIMTNSPTYEWHLNNLNNYLNLSPFFPKPVQFGGLTFTANSQGSGAIGLPGDSSSPSRFVKITYLSKVAYPGISPFDVLNVAEHVINNVDIPNGLARANNNGDVASEWTQWVVFKDLTHKIFYYRTYNDMTVRGVVMSKLDFSAKAARLKMPLAGPFFIKDFTAQFMKSRST